MIGQKISKIKLSTCKEPQQALNLIAQFLVHSHKQMGQAFPQHGAFEVKNTETLANTLLFYADGGIVEMLQEEALSQDDIEFNKEFLIEVMNDLFENDLDEMQMQQLPETHPFRLLSSRIRNQSNNQLHSKHLQNALIYLAHEVAKQDKQFRIFEKARVEKVQPQAVSITTPQGKMDLNVGFYVHRVGNQLKIETLDLPPVINENEGQKLAKSMHETMVRSEKYRGKIEESINNFVTKPNAEATALFNREKSKRPDMPDNQRPRVSVVGLGPAGAFAAIRAYQNGAIVTGIEKREKYSRNNTFRFTTEVIQQLIALFVDKPEDIAKLSPDHPLRKVLDARSLTEKRTSPLGDFHAITIKDFEYLTNCWLDMMAKKDPAGLQIYRGYSYVPGSLQNGQNEILITHSNETPPPPQSVRKIPTDFLVAADGYRSQCREDCGIQMEEMSTGTEYATFTYHPKRGDENQLFASLLKTTPRKPMDLKKLIALGWDQQRPPVPRYFNTGEHPYLGIEVPKTIANEWRQYTSEIMKAKLQGKPDVAYKLKEQRDQKLDAWGRACLEMFLTDAEIKDLVFKECSVIDVKLTRAQTPVAKMPNCTVVLVGDAAQGAHFQTGRGAITGLEEANEVGNCVDGLCKRKPIQDIVENFEKVVSRKTLSLHELAFHFPSKEDLRVRPTSQFSQFRENVRVALLHEDYAQIQPETQREAQVKAEEKTRRNKR